MRNLFVFVSSFFFFTLTIHAQKDTCSVGLFVNSIYEFRMDEKSYMADFWVWSTYKNDSLSFENNLEITNSKSAEFSNYSVEKQGEINWATQKCKAQLMHNWDVARFPFDKQVMYIEMEDAQYDTTKIVYKADQVNSKLDKTSLTNEWQLEQFVLRDTVRTYETTYGNPKLSGTSSYPKVVAEIVLKRSNSWLLLTKMLTGAYVAFLISCLVFFLSSENQDSRFGLCVGGLFAAIGNKYIVESMVPTSTTNTLMDNVHNLTFLFILLIVLITIITLNLYESGDQRKIELSKKIDRTCFYSIIGLFAVCNALMVYFASR